MRRLRGATNANNGVQRMRERGATDARAGATNVTMGAMNVATNATAVSCGKKVITSRISGPDKYRRVVLVVRWGVFSPICWNLGEL
jgi:hypothetical protein